MVGVGADSVMGGVSEEVRSVRGGVICGAGLVGRGQRGGGASCWPDQCCSLGPEAPPFPGSRGRCDAAALREAENSQNPLNRHVLMEEQAAEARQMCHVTCLTS